MPAKPVTVKAAFAVAILTVSTAFAGTIKFDMSQLNTSAHTKLGAVTIPVRLPRFLVVKNLIPDERSLFSIATDGAPHQYKHSLFSTVTVAAPHQYRIVIGAKNCEDEYYCALGYLTGQQKDNNTQSLSEVLKKVKESFAIYEDRSPQMPAEVILSNGAKGVFVPWFCAPYCNPSQLVWEEGSVQYSIALKQATKEELLETTNSVFRK